MLDLKHALALADAAALTAEIEARRKLIGEMTGTLYPGILEAEIEKLCARRADVESPGR